MQDDATGGKPPNEDGNGTASLIEKARSGDREAMNELIGLIYPELKSRARRLMIGERPGHSFGPSGSELVQRVMERILAAGGGIFEAARSEEDLINMLTSRMRYILVDYARARRGGKRADPKARIPFEDIQRREPVSRLNIEELLMMDKILTQLANYDQKAAQAFELRYYADLTNEEAAAAMGASVASFRRHLKRATVFIRALAGNSEGSGK